MTLDMISTEVKQLCGNSVTVPTKKNTYKVSIDPMILK